MTYLHGMTIIGIGDRNGRRKTGLEVTNRRGGKRVRGEGKSKLKTIKDAWLHEDAIHSKNKLIAECLKKYEIKSKYDTSATENDVSEKLV